VHTPYGTCHCGFQEVVSFFLNCGSCERTFSKRRLLVLPSDVLVCMVHTFAYPTSSRSILYAEFQGVFPIQLTNLKCYPVTFPESAPQADQRNRHQDGLFHHFRTSTPFSDISHYHLTLATYISFRRISARKCILKIKTKSHYQILQRINFPTPHSCTLTYALGSI